MVKPEWGTKRACPKCNTRFYDLTAAEPVTCINCGFAWVPEPILKSKQPLPFEVAKPVAAVTEDGDAVIEIDDDLELDVAEAENAEEPDVDLGDDDDLSAVVTGDEEEEH